MLLDITETTMPLWASVPFVLMLLMIAVCPLIHKLEHWWEKNLNKLLVSLILGTPVAIFLIINGMAHGLEHQLLFDYIPFIILLGSLFVITGGIHLKGDIEAKPKVNTLFLGLGAILASIMGTTGAAMLLIRPVIRTNAERKYKVHTILFFIACVANCGGLLTPLGDPPLFLLYLRGADFTWFLHLVPEWAFANLLLLTIYFILDTHYYKKENPADIMLDKTLKQPIRLEGKLNFLWLAGVVLSIAFISENTIQKMYIKMNLNNNDSAYTISDVSENTADANNVEYTIQFKEPLDQLKNDNHNELKGIRFISYDNKAIFEITELQEESNTMKVKLLDLLEGDSYKLTINDAANLDSSKIRILQIPNWMKFLREYILIILIILSLLTTKKQVRTDNKYSWTPIIEVAVLFLGIFTTMVPTMMYLKANAASWGLDSPWQFYYLTGAMSSFLDNAPTALAFHGVASGLTPDTVAAIGGNIVADIPEILLKAISVGAVFFGAMTYIGNGPNFMVKSIAEENGIKMPSFFGYMIKFSLIVLLPVYVLTQVIFLWLLA